MKSIFTTSVIAFAFLFIPSAADAYETTGQTAKRMSDTTAAYFITYKFGHENHDLYLPVGAVRGQDHGDGMKLLGYEVLEKAEFPAKNGTAVAVVASNAAIENGMYKVPKGYAAEFTLIVLYTTEGEASEEYAVQVTDLPFFMDDAAHRLNPSELQYYVTKAVTLNPSDLVKIIEGMKVEVKEITYSKVKK